MATAYPSIPRWRNDRLFYTAMGLFVAGLTIAGFSRTYYLSRWFDPPPTAPEMTPLLAAHAAVFTVWIALLVVQPLLIATKNRKLHRKLGYAGGVTALLMVVLGNLAAIAAMNGGFKGLGDPFVFYAVPFFGINSFAVAVALAMLWRNQPELHKRLIVLANVGIVGAAVARIPPDALAAGAPLTFILGPNLITLAGIGYDWVSRGRVHRVWIWGGLAMLVNQLVMLLIMTSGPWIAFALAMAGLW